MFAPMSESGSNGGIGFTIGIVAILVANVVLGFTSFIAQIRLQNMRLLSHSGSLN
jgi:hypothetical protein